MKNKKRASHGYTPILIILVVLVGATWGIYRVYPRPQAAPVMYVGEPSVLTFGKTSLTGTLLKDTVSKKAGKYILVLSDDKTIAVDAKVSDAMVGQKVTIDGILSPAVDANSLPTLVGVTQINTVEE